MFSIAIFETGLTIGEVAALISGFQSLVQHCLPLLWSVVLIAWIYNREHTAATWGAISASLQSSLWPAILRSDSSAVGPKNASGRVLLMSTVGLVGTIILIIASFLTVKPLVEFVRPSQHIHHVMFQYFPDQGFYGIGTVERPLRPLERICGWTKYMDCPDSIYDDPDIRNQYFNHTVVNSTIPFQTSKVFSSGTVGSTIASPMDIQYRNYYTKSDIYIDNDDLGIVGAFQPMSTFILNDDDYEIVEGLIVDTVNGGIGFRNHSLPIELELGAQWTEDLLWITPVTSCTSTNLSLHFSISPNYLSNSVNGYLQDDGGFANLAPDIPLPRWDDLDPQWKNTGTVPDLQHRSYTAAWWNNQFVAQGLGINSSAVGQTYTDQFKSYTELASSGSIAISDMDGDFLDANYYNQNSSNTGNFTAYGRRCSGFDDYNPTNSSKPYIRCGYFYGVPYPSNLSSGQSWRTDLGSNWTQHLYTCASSLKASVKTVTFSTSESIALANLTVQNVQDKVYENNSQPLWGIEKVTGYEIQDINLFWGLINETYIGQPNIEVRTTNEIYLPAANHGPTLSHVYDTFPAGSAFTAAWNSVYADAAAIKGIAVDKIPSYSGETNYGLTLKWRELSQTPDGAATILNLIWTDLSAFVAVGTKTGFETQQEGSKVLNSLSDSSKLGLRDIHIHVRIIEYNDIRYAIPAFIAITLFLVSLFLTIGICCAGRVRLRTLKHYMNHTSMGRAVTYALDPETADQQTTEEWLLHAGRLPLQFPRVPQYAVFSSKITPSPPSHLEVNPDDVPPLPPSAHTPSEDIPLEHIPLEHIPSGHAASDHAAPEHIPLEHTPSEHALSEHTPPEQSHHRSSVAQAESNNPGYDTIELTTPRHSEDMVDSREPLLDGSPTAQLRS